MNTRRALIAALAAFALGVGATCEDTHPSAPQPQAPGHDPADRKPDPKRQRVAIVTVYVEQDFLPAEVYVKVTDEDGQWEDNDDPGLPIVGQPMARKTYSQSISYTSGRKLRIHVEVKPARDGSVASYCAIDDGGGPDGFVKRQVAGAWKVTCDLTTHR